MSPVMDLTNVVDALVGLAGRAAELSNNLFLAGETANHTGTDIESMANEISILSAVLWRLHEEIIKDLYRFTESFMEDLDEINRELAAIFEEIADVVAEMRKVDSHQQGTFKGLFKKSKLAHLQRHLEALKTTLVVMRTILQHGKEYGTQRSGTARNPTRLSGSEPHVMLEDLSILESVIKTNHDAILKLHEDQSPLPDQQTQPSASHHRQPSMATTMSVPPPTIPPIPDPVSPFPTPSTPLTPNRNFSSRGTRLAVHMSILDMDAHAAPEGLKRKWIQASRAHRAGSQSHSQSHNAPQSHQYSQPHQASANPHNSPDDEQVHPHSPLKDVVGKMNLSPKSKMKPEVVEREGGGGKVEEKEKEQEKGRKKGGGWMKRLLLQIHHH